MLAKTNANKLNPVREAIKIALLIPKPILAANTFGPALISDFSTDNNFKILCDKKPIGLNFERLMLRIRKSIAKKAGTNHRRVNKKSITNETVKKPFSLATLSLIFSVEMGHAAYLFIVFI